MNGDRPDLRNEPHGLLGNASPIRRTGDRDHADSILVEDHGGRHVGRETGQAFSLGPLTVERRFSFEILPTHRELRLGNEAQLPFPDVDLKPGLDGRGRRMHRRRGQASGSSGLGLHGPAAQQDHRLPGLQASDHDLQQDTGDSARFDPTVKLLGEQRELAHEAAQELLSLQSLEKLCFLPREGIYFVADSFELGAQAHVAGHDIEQTAAQAQCNQDDRCRQQQSYASPPCGGYKNDAENAPRVEEHSRRGQTYKTFCPLGLLLKKQAHPRSGNCRDCRKKPLSCGVKEPSARAPAFVR